VTTRTHTIGGARRWACLVGCLVLFATQLAPPAGADPVDDKRAEARRIAAQLDVLGQSVSVLAEQVDGGRIRADSTAAEAAAAERDLAKAEAAAAGAKSRLAAEAVGTYVQGGMDLGTSPIAANDGDPVRRRQYAMTLQAKRTDVLDAAKAQAAIVREKRDRLAKARQEAQGAISDVEQAQKDAEAAAAKLQAAQSQVDGELAVLVQQAQDEQIAADAADVQASLAAKNPSSPVAALPPPARPGAPAASAGPGAAPAAPAAPATPTAPAGSGGPAVTVQASLPGPVAAPPIRPPAATPTTTPTLAVVAPSSGAAAAVAEARRQLGKPYRFGAAGPDAFDCSGLTAWAWRAGGRSLPHSSAAQFASLPRVNPANAQPGDLFAFGSPVHHIGIYVGGGQMIAAPETGKTVSYSAAYRRDLTGVVRP
jgi:cell wall-associated NlpC family hydrolase